MLQGPRDAAEEDTAAAAMGLLLVRPEPVAQPLWACNWPAVRLFLHLQGQWRMGPGGPVALDYTALPDWARAGQGGRRGARLLADLQVMEGEALRFFAQRKKQ